MAAGTLIPVETYLNTAYSPDVDYVDGAIQERNVGEKDHSKLQAFLIAWFYRWKRLHGLHVFPEQRVQVAASRFRVPDLCVYRYEPDEQVFQSPPWIVIEVLSKDDSLRSLQQRVDDYLAFGVEHVWAMDPREHVAYRCSAAGFERVEELRTSAPELVLAAETIFGEM